MTNLILPEPLDRSVLIIHLTQKLSCFLLIGVSVYELFLKLIVRR